MGLIKGKQLADSAIVADKLADGAVGTNKLAGSIPVSKLSLAGTFDFASAGGTVIVGTASQSSHAVNKGYVDSVKQSLDIKDSVRACSTSDIASEVSSAFSYSSGVLTESSNNASSFTIDGVNLTLNDRVLLKEQGTGSQNGIYTITQVGDGSTTPWILTRATDFDSDADISSGAFCFVEEGTTNGDAGFVLTTNETITLDTTSLTFTQFNGAGQVTAGEGLSKSGNTLNVDLAINSGLSTSIAGSNGKLGIDGSVLADGILAVADDELFFIDSDGGTKRDSIVDFVSAMTSAGLVANNGLLSVDLLSTGGLELSGGEIAVKLVSGDSSLTSDANGLKVNLHADGSIAIKGSAGIASAVPQNSDQAQTPSAVTGDNTSSGLTISATPSADSLVLVRVNGVGVELGDGVKTKDCYFSGDSGTTARAISAITLGDTLYWNGASVYALEVSDLIDFIYVAV